MKAKTKFKRMVAVILAAFTCLSVTACSTPKNIDEKWELTLEDYGNAIFLDSETELKDGTRTVTLTSEESELKSNISKDKVCITALPLAEEDLLSYSTEESDSLSSMDETDDTGVASKEKFIDDFTLEQKDNKTLVLSFKEEEYDSGCIYMYFVHKDCVEDKVYAIGSDYIDPTQKAAPTGKIATNHANLQENPTIEIKLNNAKPVSDIKAEDITLSGAFKDLKISSVEASGDTIKLQTVGTVKITDAPYGYVDLSAKTNDAEKEIFAFTEINNIDVYLDDATFEYNDKILSFDVDVAGKELELSNEGLASSIKLDEFKIEKTEISEDKKSFKLYVNVDANDIDDAVNKLNYKTLSIDSKAVGFDGIEYIISVSTAVFKVNVNSIDKPEGDSDKYTASAEIYPISGDLKDLEKSDISFEGDFADAEIILFKKTDNSYTFDFNFTCKDNEKTIFSGVAKLAEGKLLNEWGTASASLSSSAEYLFENSKASGYDEIKELVKNIKIDGKTFFKSKSFVDNIMKLGEQVYSGKYSDALGTGKAILGMLGVIDTRSGEQKALDEIRSIVLDTKLLVENVDKKIVDLNDKLEHASAEFNIGVSKSTIQGACGRWGDFISQYIDPMEAKVNIYNARVQEKFVDFVNNSKTLDIYFDINGKMTNLKGKTRDMLKSVDGKEIDESKTITIKLDRNNLKNSLNALDEHSDKYSKDLTEAFKKDMLEILKVENNAELAATEENAEMLLVYVQTKISLEALNENGFNTKFIEQYKNLCDAISGKETISYLDAYFTYITTSNNFQDEAEEDLLNMNNYLTVSLFKYGCLASYAADYHSGISDDDTSISDAWNSAIKALENTGIQEVKDGERWCYVVGRPVSAASAKFVRHYRVNSKQTIVHLRAKGVNRPSIKYKYYGLDYDYVRLEDQKTNKEINSAYVLSGTQLAIIKNRFDNMNLGISFREYMTNRNVFKLNSDANLVVAGRVSTESIPLDGKVELTCTDEHYSDYNVDENYKIGKSNKSDISIHERHNAVVFDFNNCSYKTQAVFERAHYGQSHWYWSKDEDARFENTALRDTTYAVFTIR